MKFLKLRLAYIFTVPPLLVLDAVTSLLGAVGAFAYGLVSQGSSQQTAFSYVARFANSFSKSCLGFAFSLLGVINPKFLSFFFNPTRHAKDEVVSGGDLYHKKAIIKTPTTDEELQDIVRQAKANGQKVMPKGAGFSQGKQYIPEGCSEDKPCILIDMKDYNQVGDLSDDGESIEVEAGATWDDIQMKLNAKKKALKVMQASNVFSVGGSLGTNIHGWDHKSGTLGSIVKRVRVLFADGEIRWVERGSEDFKAVVAGFGLCGIILKAEIEVTNNENLKECGTKVSIEEYVQHFRDNVESNPETRMHLFRLSLDPKGLLQSGVSVDYKITGNTAPVVTKDLTQEGERGSRMDRILVTAAKRIPFVRKQYWQGEEKRLLEHETPMTTNEIMQPAINGMFNGSVSESEWLQEYFIPGENLDGFLKELGQLLMDNDVALLNGTVRFVKQDTVSHMGYAKGGDRFAVVLCFNQSLKESELRKAKIWIRESIDLALKHQGTYYLPYQQFASKEQFEKAYTEEQRTDFLEAKKRLDPDNVFASGLYQQYLADKSHLPKDNKYFQGIVANDEIKKEFRGFIDNVLKQVDADKFFELLEDIIKYCDTHEEIYTELLKRMPEIKPGTFSFLGRVLDSLSTIKKDLSEQAQALMPEVKTIDGMVEIGYPGRFVSSFKEKFDVTGQITTVHEGEGLSDFIQTGFPRPNDAFQELNYNLPCLDKDVMADNSADVITCFVGLHHFPDDQLDAFLQDVRRVLKPGGHFLLVDHDVVDEKSMMMAHMAHSVFNAVTGASVKEEMTETRNFRSMEEWTAKLAKNDLANAPGGAEHRMIREGDPSRNRMCHFTNTKKPEKTADVVADATAGSPKVKVHYGPMFSPAKDSDKAARVVLEEDKISSPAMM